jgi:predicted amidophosphoribosyltransferase
MDKKGRLQREKVTVEKMIKIYCKQMHSRNAGLCSECSELLDYAHSRLDKCKFGVKKPVCARCNIHCFENSMRKKIRTVMSYSGPRMLILYPILAIKHLIDSFSKDR